METASRQAEGSIERGNVARSGNILRGTTVIRNKFCVLMNSETEREQTDESIAKFASNLDGFIPQFHP